MKTYITFITHAQEVLLGISVVMLATLPATIVLLPALFTNSVYLWLYGTSHLALFLVMVVRPTADIFTGVRWIRPLVILRKGVGVLSASVIVSFIIAKLIADAGGYLSGFLTPAYWSLENLALFAHLADISAVLLLVTSNNLSKRLFGKNWKRIQRLSYVYFYASALYVFFVLNETYVLFYLTVVTAVTLIAWFKNHGFFLKKQALQTV